MSTLDQFDRKILDCLQRDGRLTNSELGEAVGLSASQCSRRRTRLESSGIIRGYGAKLDLEKRSLKKWSCNYAPFYVFVPMPLLRQWHLQVFWPIKPQHLTVNLGNTFSSLLLHHSHSFPASMGLGPIPFSICWCACVLLCLSA